MAKEKLDFDAFIAHVSPPYQPDMLALNDRLLKEGLNLKVEQAANGPVASYMLNKKTVFNFIFRKSGMQMRLYGENLASYENLLTDLPAEMNKAIEKAGVCRRLSGTAPCSDRCPMGYVFHFKGNEVKKCRYGMIMPANDVTFPALFKLIDSEIACRKGAAA